MDLSRNNHFLEIIFFLVFIVALTLTLVFFPIKIFSLYFLFLIFFIIALFLVNNKLGFFLLILIRPLLDIFTANSLLQIGRLSLNISSVLAVFVIAISTIIFAKYRSRIKKIPLKKIWWLFLGITLFSIVFSFNRTTSLTEWIRFISFYSFFLLGFLVIKNRTDFLELLKVVAYSAIIPSFFALYQFITEKGMTIPLEGITNRIYGTFAHPNLLAYYLVFLISALGYLIIIRDKNIFLNYLITAFYTFILLLTFTRGAWLALLLVFFIIGSLKYRKMLVALTVFLLIIYVAVEPIRMRVNALYEYNPNSSIEWRKGIWKDGIGIAKEKILGGHGTGTSQEILLETRGPESGSPDPHNDYLKMLIENGLIGVLTYILLIFSLIYKLARNYLAVKNIERKDLYLVLFAFSVAIFTMSFADNILRSTVLQWSFWAVIGGALAISRK